MLRVKFINHASVLVKSDSVGILSDPWYTGGAFFNAWGLLYENQNLDIENLIVEEVTHIWLSHEHPDHFSVVFFKEFKELLIKKEISILFQKTADKRVYNFLNSLGLNVIEIDLNKETIVSSDTSVICIKDGFYDSGLLIKNSDGSILNLNDCEINNTQRLNEVFSITGEVDILLTQFSYAAWKGGPENRTWRRQAAAAKLTTIKSQIEKFKPRKVIPFASFVWFCNDENFYLNQDVNTIETVILELDDFDDRLCILQPYDELSIDDQWENSKARKFWKKQYDEIKRKKRNLHVYESVSEEALINSFIKYCDRIHKNNSVAFMKLIRFFGLFNVFHSSRVYLRDLQIGYEINYIDRTLEKITVDFDISMHSSSLNFIFSNNFGFDTLTVNGCFTEESAFGFARVAKNLAIENLNNLGITFGPRIVFNHKIIGMFLERLRSVNKKLGNKANY